MHEQCAVMAIAVAIVPLHTMMMMPLPLISSGEIEFESLAIVRYLFPRMKLVNAGVPASSTKLMRRHN